MPHADVLRTLVEELERVGVDADQMVAGLSTHADEAIRALRALPDHAGPAAWLKVLCIMGDKISAREARGTCDDASCLTE